ncbi:ABC transporter permease [Ferrovibrio sp.]|uniref:ABC transporter permease n=1 Tax=Ferrovibrio sp. TaxID=1917215 RepID=UPI003D2B94D8
MHKPNKLVAFIPMLVVLGIYGSAFAVFVIASFRAGMPDGRIDNSVLGWHNYRRFFETAAATDTLLDTFLISFLLTVITLVLAFPFAYQITRTQSSAIRRILLGVVMVTFLSGGITRAYAWMVVLGNNGLINRVLAELGFGRLPLLYNLNGVVTALVHFLLPFCILTLIGTFQTLPRNLEEAATSLGASRLRTFWLVTVPLTLRGAVGAGILTLSVAVSSFLFPLLLGGGKVRMMSNHIYELIFINFDIPFAAATAVIFLLTTIILVSLLTFVLGALTNDSRWSAAR